MIWEMAEGSVGARGRLRAGRVCDAMTIDTRYVGYRDMQLSQKKDAMRLFAGLVMA